MPILKSEQDLFRLVIRNPNNFQAQIVLVKRRFVVGRVQVKECPGAIVAFNKLMPRQVFNGYGGQAQVDFAKLLLEAQQA